MSVYELVSMGLWRVIGAFGQVGRPRLLQQIARETGSVIGGELFPSALSDKDGPAATYLELMRHNATTITAALSEAKKQ